MTEEIATPVKPKHHRRHVWVAVGVTQLVLALVTAGGVTLAYNHLNNNIGPGEAIYHPEPKPASDDKQVDDAGRPMEPLNILVMGSDSRSGVGNDIDGLGDIGQRADTTILLHVSANRRNAYGVSLPRDAIIDRPDCHLTGGKVVPGEDSVMFNTAFAVGYDASGTEAGGAQCASETVAELTGIYIDHFLVLDFNGFKAMVDAVHGVEVCLPKAVDDYEHNIHLAAGTQTLTGQDALNYVRERYTLSVTGDIGRMKRQQAFIASMTKKVLSAGTLSQPTRVFGFLNAVTSSITVDDGLDTVRKLGNLAMEFRDTGLDKIKFITVPNAPYEPDPNRLVWTDAADDLWARIIADQQLGKDFSADSIDADDPVGTTDDPTENSTDDPNAEAQAQERLQAGLCA